MSGGQLRVQVGGFHAQRFHDSPVSLRLLVELLTHHDPDATPTARDVRDLPIDGCVVEDVRQLGTQLADAQIGFCALRGHDTKGNPCRLVYTGVHKTDSRYPHREPR